MALPIQTTEEDIDNVVQYLKTKVMGATLIEAKPVLDAKKTLDPRKVNTYITWGIIQKEGDKIKLAPIGVEISKATTPEKKAALFASILRQIKPYNSMLEKMFHQKSTQVTNVDVARHWVEYNKAELGTDIEDSIKNMAVCFFHLCQAARIGQLKIGRKGLSTRLDVNFDALQSYISESTLTPITQPDTNSQNSVGEEVLQELKVETRPNEVEEKKEEPLESKKRTSNKPRIFISHSNNLEIVDQIKTMLDLAEIDFEVAEEEESAAIPVPEKVLSAMRKCNAAVICVTADSHEKRDNGTYGINQNVLIEIGAAFVLYDKKVVLIWEKTVAIPSNLQGLYRCEFSGDELSWSAGMKLMKAVSNFKTKNVDE